MFWIKKIHFRVVELIMLNGRDIEEEDEEKKERIGWKWGETYVNLREK